MRENIGIEKLGCVRALSAFLDHSDARNFETVRGGCVFDSPNIT